MRRAQARLEGMDGVRATYQDVLDAPEGVVAELVGGRLWLSARPSDAHAEVQQALAHVLARRFDHRLRDDGPDVPGGWVLRQEPELWLGGAVERDPVLVPDVAAWRVGRFPHGFGGHGFTVVPDWVCEVRSPRDGGRDRLHKLPLYLRHGVAHVWLVDPLERAVEVYVERGGLPALLASAVGEGSARLPPFDGEALEAGRWWPDEPGAAG